MRNEGKNNTLKNIKEIIKRIILDNQERDYSFVKERDFSIDMNFELVHSFVGVRRSGKTSLLFNLINRLKTAGKKENILYLNCEDDRLAPAEASTISQAVDVYFELYPSKREDTVYFFFDEIQAVAGWERVVRRLYDTEKCRIFITGSSSRLLLKEISSSMRGRSIPTEVFPLSFKEYLRFKNIEYDKITSKTLSFISHSLNEYLRKGGFPQSVNYSFNATTALLQEYMDLIVYKDLVERYSVSNLHLMKYLVRFCFSNMSNLISINKLNNDFRSMGMVFSRRTLYEYLGYMEDIHAIYMVPVFSKSFKEQQRNPRKIYGVDPGFNNVVTTDENTGRLVENAVFLHLRRKNRQIYYFKKNQEVDFYLPEGEQKLINVSWNISDTKTMYRELEGLQEAMEHFGVNEAYLINENVEDKVKKGNNLFHIIPLWKFLLF